jgi:mannitol-1-phosphate 5-dehydrogenase
VKLVQFGAGNIGRSFIGQIFCRAGWEVVFIDVDEKIVSLLN